MKFLGLAVPGASGLSSIEDLVAVWRAQRGVRFQNYRAIFTILDEEKISHKWLKDLVKGIKPIESKYCPKSWINWVKNGTIKALKCKTTKVPRVKENQLPTNKIEEETLEKIYELTETEFEYAAKEIIKLFDNKFVNLEVTPPVKDGGRDVIGEYKIGHKGDNILLDIFVEAKRWKKGIGVKPMARLISRMKHKDLGVFITTSYFNKQVQEELIEDQHPIILISGGDIARILIEHEIGGENNKGKLIKWISQIKNKI